MTTSDLETLGTHPDDAEKIRKQVAFASELFQGDITVRNLLESLAKGVVVIDNTGAILLVNVRDAQMFGYLSTATVSPDRSCRQWRCRHSHPSLMTGIEQAKLPPTRRNHASCPQFNN